MQCTLKEPLFYSTTTFSMLASCYSFLQIAPQKLFFCKSHSLFQMKERRNKAFISVTIKQIRKHHKEFSTYFVISAQICGEVVNWQSCLIAVSSSHLNKSPTLTGTTRFSVASCHNFFFFFLISSVTSS